MTSHWPFFLQRSTLAGRLLVPVSFRLYCSVRQWLVVYLVVYLSDCTVAFDNGWSFALSCIFQTVLKRSTMAVVCLFVCLSDCTEALDHGWSFTCSFTCSCIFQTALKRSSMAGRLLVRVFFRLYWSVRQWLAEYRPGWPVSDSASDCSGSFHGRFRFVSPCVWPHAEIGRRMCLLINICHWNWSD